MCELCLPSITRRRALGLMGVATAGALLGRPHPATAARSLQTGYGVAIEPRATWAGDDRPELGSMADEDVRFLLVHHTAGPSEGDPIGLMRQVYDFHTGPDRGWPDVAYNFFVEPGGRVFEARAGSLRRAVEASATGGSQGFAQLVCLLGDFTNRNPTDAQLRSLNETLAWLADRFGLDTSGGSTTTFTSRGSNKWSAGSEVTADIVSGHREMSATACPGDTFFPYLKDRVQFEVEMLRTSSLPVADPISDGSVPPAATVATTNAPESTSPAANGPNTTGPDTTGPVPTVADTTRSASTVPPSAADGPVATPPDPSAAQSAVESTESAASGNGASSNAARWGLGVGATAVAAGAAVYVGARRRDLEITDGVGVEAPTGDSGRPPPGDRP